jgi:GH24 family phage-related lysozyme (muramidase)
MNKDRLREEIAADEGVKLNENGEHILYLDHLGLVTMGVGHLVVEGDPEHGQPVGTPVSDERVRQAFALDIAVTIEDCRRLCKNVDVDFDALDEEPQMIFCNMAFNLGYPRFSKFRRFWGNVAKAVDEPAMWNSVADEAVDSRWHDQVPNRAKRLVKRLRVLADG